MTGPVRRFSYGLSCQLPSCFYLPAYKISTTVEARPTGHGRPVDFAIEEQVCDIREPPASLRSRRRNFTSSGREEYSDNCCHGEFVRFKPKYVAYGGIGHNSHQDRRG